MQEIEVKAKLQDRERVIEALKKRGCAFTPEVVQHDVIYTQNAGSLEKFRNNTVYLRIRVKNDGTILFTSKTNKGDELACQEHETEIASKEEMEQALFCMGYQKAVEVKKKRITTQHDGCEICIDDVEGLGQFIEMEKMSAEGNEDAVQEELFTFFESLGVSRDDRVLYGYDTLTLMRDTE